jgi:two-component system cell cycle response regulator
MIQSMMDERLLIVEDSEGIAGLQERILTRAGFSVSIARSGGEALGMIKDSEPPALLIIDYRLPDMNGVDLLGQLSEDGHFIPSIMVTAMDDAEIAVAAMKLGALDYIIKDDKMMSTLPALCKDAIKKARLAEENVRLMEELKIANDLLVEANQKLEEMARTDDLTKTLNRRALLEHLEREVARSRRSGSPLSFALLDIDGFKLINDTYGHLVGDEVLAESAKRIKKRLRRTDFFGRYGGEEFGVVLPDTAIQGAANIGEDLRQALRDYCFECCSKEVFVTMSVGVAMLKEGMDMRAIIDIADKSMYHAKDSGKNCVVALQDGILIKD